jgi:hypothetical protein
MVMSVTTAAYATDIYVPPGGDLQDALNRAKAGDTVLLEPGTTYEGHFVLPVHAGTSYVTVRSAAASIALPPTGVRISPGYADALPKIRSTSNMPALRTAPGAAYWKLMFLELGPGAIPTGDILDLGDGSPLQSTLATVPHHLIVDRVYIHGDAVDGGKRGVGLNSGDTTIVNSYISDIKAVGIDTQAIGGWNGPGPYRIENNYLEASTEVIMFGGDDPKIPNLVASDIVVRGNTLRRPRGWKFAILPAPTATTVAVTGTGTLPAGTYAYRVLARRQIGNTQVKSTSAAEVAVTVGSGSRVTVRWTPVPNATEYLVYGRTPGGQSMYWIVTTPSFTDDGTSIGTDGTPSLTPTVWQVKNLFELKNARRLQIDHNVMENNWVQAQAGTAIVFTPRNQYGACPWCVVEDVTFEYNIVRSVGAGIQILGIDNRLPSQQANGIRIRNNEFSDINKTTWGGSGYFVTITGGPRDVVIDHNTIVSPSGSGVVNADGEPVTGFVFTNNVARHNTYGIIGGGQGMGRDTLDYYFPGSLIARNVLAGGKASRYPSGNLFPTEAQFQAHFVNYAGGDFTLVPGTDWERAGTDGLDLGADQIQVHAGPAASAAEGAHITTKSLTSTTEGMAYNDAVEGSGGVQPYRWSVVGGALPPGLSIDAISGIMWGRATEGGRYAFVVQLADEAGTTTNHAFEIGVIPAVRIATSLLPNAITRAAYGQAMQATGGMGTYTWRITGGRLPAGLALTADGRIAGVAMTTGVSQFEVTAYDAVAPTRFASRTLTIAAVPPPNQPPTIALSSPVDGAVLAVGETVAIVAAAADPDGTVQRVDFYVNDVFVDTATGHGLQTTTWMVPKSGTYRFTAVATDNHGDRTTSAAVTTTTRSDVVIRAAQASRRVGEYRLDADVTAADGLALMNADRGAAKVPSAAAQPASFAEFTFVAEAGRPYHLWIRGKATRDLWSSDSMFVQFSGVASARIGTGAALVYSLEKHVNTGVEGWGWQDNGYGLQALGADIVFETTGAQTIRLQPREDGLAIDQIVLSPGTFHDSAPGAAKNDSTIVPR